MVNSSNVSTAVANLCGATSNNVTSGRRDLTSANGAQPVHHGEGVNVTQEGVGYPALLQRRLPFRNKDGKMQPKPSFSRVITNRMAESHCVQTSRALLPF